MKKVIVLVLIVLTYLSTNYKMNAAELIDEKYPIGKPGLKLTYSSQNKNLPESVVQKFDLTVGAIEEINEIPYQWLQLTAEKVNKQTFSVWILALNYPSGFVKTAQKNITRYILSISNSTPIEFMNQTYGGVVLPNTGVWKHLMPRLENGNDPIKLLDFQILYENHNLIIFKQKVNS